MRRLYEEICVRFPEIRDVLFPGDEELPYVMIGRVTEWLIRLPREAVTPEIVARAQAFTAWCEEKPSGETAADDVHTILVVGFYEKLFESEEGRALLPKFISNEDLTRNADYLKTWVGNSNYVKATNAFPHNA